MDIVVSIDCITYNHENYIRDALDSFLMQEASFKYEILIHDDASTDATQNIIKEYQIKYPKIIKPYFQQENQYSKGVRRIGVRYNHPRAKGKYIAICEGDDYWTDRFKLQKQVEFMEKNQNLSMCCHSSEKVFNDKSKIGEIRPFRNDKIITPQEIILGGGGLIATNSMMYRKEILHNIPDFFWESPVGDYAFQLYFAEKGECFYHDSMMSAYRRGVAGSWSSNSILARRKEFMTNHLFNTIKTLESFNKYSYYKYQYAVSSRIEELDFQIRSIKGEKKALKSKYYSSLSFKQKLKYFIIIYFPKIVDKYRKFKNHL